MLQITLLVLRNILERVTIASPGYECCSVDDEGAQVLESGLKFREKVVARPDVCSIILWEVGKFLDGHLVQSRVLYGVGIVGTLEGIITTILEGFFSTTPTYEVTAFGVLEFFLSYEYSKVRSNSE